MKKIFTNIRNRACLNALINVLVLKSHCHLHKVRRERREVFRYFEKDTFCAVTNLFKKKYLPHKDFFFIKGLKCGNKGNFRGLKKKNRR